MEIDIGNRLIIFVVLLGVSAFLCSIFYRRTVPPVSSKLRHLLATVRFLSLGILVLLLIEPVIAFVLTRHDKPRIGLLIDNTMSMGIEDEEGKRMDTVKGILESEDFALLLDRVSLETYLFADSVRGIESPDPDSLNADGIGTDIGGALKKVATRFRKPDEIILLSDGAENLGEGAAQISGSLGIPVHAVAIGDPRGREDIRISEVSAPDVAYADSELSVDITVLSSGYRGNRVPVYLKRNGRTLREGELTLAGDFKAQNLKLGFTPEEPGPYRFEVSIPPQTDEASEDNNRRTFFVNVLKSKLDILLISGGPGPEFAFLKRTLEKNNRISLTALVARDSSGFYGANPAEDVGGFDIVIISDLPHRLMSPGMEASIVEKVKEKKIALLIMGGARLRGYQGTSLGELFPATISYEGGFVPGEFNIVLTDKGLSHIITKLSDEPSENQRLWTELPPFSGINRTDTLEEEVVVLATCPDPSDGKGEIPLIMLRKYGRGKVTLFPFSGSWRWDLMAWGTGGTNTAYKKFWDNVISWLSSGEFGASLKLSTDQMVYRGGEEVRLRGSLYDESYQPIDVASVSVSISGDRFKRDLVLENLGSGRYSGRISGLPPGDFSVKGTAELKARRVADTSGSFTVEPYNIEFENTAMDAGLMRQIAERSGGSFHTPEQFGKLLEEIELDERPYKARYELDISRTPWILIVFIVLISSEWAIRRRKGMI